MILRPEMKRNRKHPCLRTLRITKSFYSRFSCDIILHSIQEIDVLRKNWRMILLLYGKIEGVSQPVSRIFLGTASPPFNTGLDGSELLEAALSQGINAIDTARVYGLSENSLGTWLDRPGNREKVVLLSKCGHPAEDGARRVCAAEMRRDLEISLEALRTDHIDIYLLHRDDPEVAVGPLMDALNRCVDEGKLGALGVSNWTIPRIEAANEYAAKHNLRPFTVSSPNFGLAEQVCDLWGGGCVTIAGPENAEARAWYARNSVPVFAYSSLARGLFSGRVKSDDPDSVNTGMDAFGVKGYACDANIERLRRCEIMAAQKGLTVPQVAMAWLFNQRALDVYALVSTSRPENMRDNIAASEVALTDAECAWLDLRQETI